MHSLVHAPLSSSWALPVTCSKRIPVKETKRMEETQVDETKRDIFLWRTLGWTNSGGCGMWRRIEVGSGQE